MRSSQIVPTAPEAVPPAPPLPPRQSRPADAEPSHHARLMGFQQLEAAYGVTAGTPANKAVLLALAWHSCDSCGLAWPGVAGLAKRTELGSTRVRDSLAAIVASGFAIVFRFPYGGRGLTTEYLVLPGLRELSTAPCGKCAALMKNPPPPGVFPARNPTPGGAFVGNPPEKPPEIDPKATRRVETNSHSTDNSQRDSVAADESSLATGQGTTLAATPPNPVPPETLDLMRTFGLTESARLLTPPTDTPKAR